MAKKAEARPALPVECSWCNGRAEEWGVIEGRPPYAACAEHKGKLDDLLATVPGTPKRIRE